MTPMSWLFGRSSEPESTSSQVPDITHGQKQKHRQIEWLREQVVGVVELERDEHYRVTFNVNGLPLTLDITLPPRFPLSGPVVRVSPPVRHPWVDSQMVVDGSPLIKNFTVHSNLGRAINQVIKEFNSHPPKLLSPESNMTSQLPPPQPSSLPGRSQPPAPIHVGGYTPYVFNSMPQPVASQTRGTSSPDTSRTRRPAPPPPSGRRMSYQVPPVPDSLEDIKSMSTEDLNRFLSDEEGPVLIDRYVSQMDVIKKVQADKERLFQENEDQASINLGHEPELQEGWEQLQQKFLELEGLEEEHDKMLNRQRQLVERYQPKTVTSRLKTLTQNAETESEVIAEDFMDKKMEVTEFSQKHKEQRKHGVAEEPVNEAEELVELHHLRKIKYEKLTYTSSAY